MAPKRKAAAAPAALSEEPVETAAAKRRKSSMAAKPRAKPASSTQVPCPHRDAGYHHLAQAFSRGTSPLMTICMCSAILYTKRHRLVASEFVQRPNAGVLPSHGSYDSV